MISSFQPIQRRVYCHLIDSGDDNVVKNDNIYCLIRFSVCGSFNSVNRQLNSLYFDIIILKNAEENIHS